MDAKKVPCSFPCPKFFSVALAITNIIGVFLAGFGTPFESLSDEKGIAFLKVRTRSLKDQAASS